MKKGFQEEKLRERFLRVKKQYGLEAQNWENILHKE